MTLGSPPCVIVRQLLLDRELGVVNDEQTPWPVFHSFMPDDRNDIIVVYDTVGKLDGRLMSTGEQIEHPGIQIQIAGRDYASTWRKANEIALNLDRQISAEVTVNEGGEDITYRIQDVFRTSPILPMGMEPEGKARRYRFSINCLLTLAVSPNEDHSPFPGYAVLSGDIHTAFVLGNGSVYFVQPPAVPMGSDYSVSDGAGGFDEFVLNGGATLQVEES